MGNEKVEKLLKDGLHLKDDILKPQWCPRCRALTLDGARVVGVFCRHCEGEVLVAVEAQVVDGKVVFRKRE